MSAIKRLEVTTMDDMEKKYMHKITEPLKLKSITHVNHSPHPYTIGSKHIAHAHDNCGGRLGEDTMEAVPCAAKGGCSLSYAEHTSDLVMFVELTRNCKNKEVADVLFPIKGEMEADKIDGVAFVETDEEYRVEADSSCDLCEDPGCHGECEKY